VARSDRPRSPRKLQRKWLALWLAVIVHAAFIAFLVVSVRWQNRPPAPVVAELYAPPVKAVAPPKQEPAAQPPPPKPEPPVPPKPEPPLPPKAEPRPLPKADPKPDRPDPRQTDIALKAKQEDERKKKEEVERERKDLEKKERDRKDAEDRKKQEAVRTAEIRERQQREIEALRAQAERETQARAQAQEREALLKEQAEREGQQRARAAAAAAERSRAEEDWIRRIQAKVRGNVIVPELSGNPEAIFDIVQLPTGEIIDVHLRRSSGVRAYDDAVQRAILKSSPLPRPERTELFQRTLALKFRPRD